MSSLVDLLNEHTPLSPPFGGLVVVLALFVLAALVSRGAGRLVHGPVVMWADEHAERRFARATRMPVATARSR